MCVYIFIGCCGHSLLCVEEDNTLFHLRSLHTHTSQQNHPPKKTKQSTSRPSARCRPTTSCPSPPTPPPPTPPGPCRPTVRVYTYVYACMYIYTYMYVYIHVCACRRRRRLGRLGRRRVYTYVPVFVCTDGRWQYMIRLGGGGTRQATQTHQRIVACCCCSCSHPPPPHTTNLTQTEAEEEAAEKRLENDWAREEDATEGRGFDEWDRWWLEEPDYMDLDG